MLYFVVLLQRSRARTTIDIIKSQAKIYRDRKEIWSNVHVATKSWIFCSCHFRSIINLSRAKWLSFRKFISSRFSLFFLLTFRRRAWYGWMSISRMITSCTLGIPIIVRSNYQTRFTKFCHLSNFRTCDTWYYYTYCAIYACNTTQITPYHAWRLKVNDNIHRNTIIISPILHWAVLSLSFKSLLFKKWSCCILIIYCRKQTVQFWDW